MGRKYIAWLALAVLSVSSFLEAGGRHALVIGIGRYDHLPGRSQLKVAVRDAEIMSEALKKGVPPFSVTLVRDAEQDALEDRIETFLTKSAEAECALIYLLRYVSISSSGLERMAPPYGVGDARNVVFANRTNHPQREITSA